jgi:predicted N-acetyltransferase YhbS
VKFRLATPADDPALRALAGREAMPGALRIQCRREPDFHAGLRVQGNAGQTIVAEEAGTIVGMGCRALREAYVNGSPMRIGYLSGLRSLESARGGMGLVRGYRFLRELHAADPVPAYLTTIMEGNAPAIALLESGRAGLPRYRRFARFTTHAVLVRRRCAPTRMRPAIVSAREAGLADTVRWLNRAGAGRQFFPVFREDDFGSPLLRDLSPSDLFVARERGQVCGSVAAWDQSAFKQFVLAGTAPWIRAGLAVLAPIARLAGWPSLPPAGGALSVVFAAWLLIEPGRNDLAAALLDRVLDWAAMKGAAFCVIGFLAGDPAGDVVRRKAQIAFRSRAYLVDWEDGPDLAAGLDGRPAHLEAAVL